MDYEYVLFINDILVLDCWFWYVFEMVCYGVGEVLLGGEVICQYCKICILVLGLCKLYCIVVIIFGCDYVMVFIEFIDYMFDCIGCQMQIWVCMDEGWCIVVVYVSLMV